MKPLKKINQDDISAITSLVSRSIGDECKNKIKELDLTSHFILKYKSPEEQQCIGYELQNLDITIDSNANFLQLTNIEDGDTETFSVGIKNCVIHTSEQNINNQLYFKNIRSSDTGNRKWSTCVFISDTAFENVEVYFQVKNEVSLHNITGNIKILSYKPTSRITFNQPQEKLDTTERFEILGKKNLTIDNLQVDKNVRILRITNTNIHTTNLGDLYEPQNQDSPLHTLEFDTKSMITDTSIAKSTYKRLRLLAKILDDRIQAHIFYVKELQSYSRSENISWDDRVLIWINDTLNKNGTSFIQPLLIMLGLNLILLVTIFLVIENCYDPKYYDLRNVVLPTHSILLQDHQYSYWSYFLDGLRRVMNSVLIFMTASAALRFRFK